ncbi:thiol-disulfide oxidoreductase DCC family protein [Herminiimonas aquatilis]|uniref:Thiol-disulfide oxidoreductase DCC family protein n=1 Tax=Herminiimonas aquatilis TaxID=345342 RepID=A0ABW2J945_9BURK
MNKDADSQSNGSTKVMFDGACPLCRREIAIYQKIQANEDIAWVDVSACDFQPPVGMTKAQLLKRFHLITPDGDILSGAEAFVFVWNRLPGWRWLGRCARLPGMMFLMEWLYRGFLVVRPGLQQLARFFAAKQ